MKPYYEEKGIVLYHAKCEDVLPELDKVDLVLTDPPYGEQQASWDKDKPSETIWDSIYQILNDGGTLYYWGFWGHADWVLMNAKRVGFTPMSRIVWWFKTGRPKKKSYREDTEECWYFGKGEPLIFNADEFLEPYGDPSNYARYERKGKHPGTVWEHTRLFHNHPETVAHETQKPLAIFKKIVGISSEETSLILDPFCGSGTTLLAAKQLGRKAIGIEMSEKYCEIAVKRLAQTQFEFSP